MIRLTYQPNWFDHGAREVSDCAVPESGLLRDLIPGGLSEDLEIVRNGVRVEDPETATVSYGDFVYAARVPGGPETLILIAISFVAQLVAGALVPKLKPPRDRDDDSSPTYSYRGIQSNRGEGNPIGVVFGRIRTGGQIINEFYEQRRHTAANADYLAQICFGEGPIKSIAGITADTEVDYPRVSGDPSRPIPDGIQINAVGGDTMEGIEAHVRLGSLEQEPTAGFEFTSTPIEVGSTLTQNTLPDLNAPGASSEPEIITLASSQAIQDAAWAGFAVTVDVNTDLFDAARLHFELPNGLYFQASNGVIYPALVRFIVRYQELTSGGSPITTGGQFNDGWVRLTGEAIRTKHIGAFGVDALVPFYDPATYTAPSYGYSLGITTTFATPSASECVISSPTLPAGWVNATAVTEMSGEIWAEFDQLDFDGGNPSHQQTADHVLFQQTPGSGNGFRFALRKKTFTSAPGVTASYWVPVLEVSGVTAYHELITETLGLKTGIPSTTIAQGDRHHYAFTYKANLDGGTQDRLRIFVDGDLVYEVVRNVNMLYSTADIYVARDPNEDQPSQGRFDEFRLLHRELSINEVRQSYNQGRGVSGDSTIPGLVVGLHFDDNSTSAAVDYSPFGNDASIAGSASSQSPGFILTEVGNTRKRSRWRVQVMRNNLDWTDPAIQDDIELSSVDGLIDEAFSYPGCPHLDVVVKASDQQSGSAPQVSAVVEGLLLKTWDGASPRTAPAFDDIYSRNPAWVAATWALGRRFALGDQFKTYDLDVTSLQAWADRCAELVYDSRGDKRQGNLASGDWDEFQTMLFRTSVVGAPEYDGRGQILINFGPNTPPEHWEVGGYLGWTGEAVATGHVDSNTPTTGGYEILYIGEDTGNWAVSVAWDRLDEGTPWDDGTFLHSNATDVPPYTGTIEGREPRLTYDAVHDTEEDAWDVLLGICSVGRAAPIIQGDRLRFHVDMPREPVAVIGMGQIVEDSFEMEYLNLKERPNQLAMQFLDEDLNYEQSLARLAHASISTTTDSSAVREETVSARGIVRRSQAMRHLKLELNEAEFITRKCSFTAAMDAIHYQVGDVVILSHDLVLWGLSGRLDAIGDESEVYLDREIVVEASTDYYLRVRDDATGEWARASVDVASLGTGTFAAGTAIPLSPGLPFMPSVRAPYLWHADGEEFLATITGLRTNEDLSVEVMCSEYSASLYDDSIEDLEPATGTVTEPSSEILALQAPPEARQVRVEEVALTRRDGTEVPGLRVSWAATTEGARRTASWAIWWKPLRPQASLEPWEDYIEVDASQRTIEIPLPSAVTGDGFAVSVQPISSRGSKARPEICAQSRVVVQLDGRRPSPPTNLAVSWVDDQAVYSWDLPADGPNLVVEARRGGWILGQPVFTSAPGATSYGQTTNWAVGTLYVRTRSAAGFYSEVVTLEVDSSSVDLVSEYIDLDGMSAEWSDYVDGWIDDGAASAPNPFVTDLARQSDGTLSFNGSALTAYYTTADPTLSKTVTPRELYLEASVVASQVLDLAWEDATYAWGSNFARALTWEGLAHAAARTAPRVRLFIEVRLTIDGTSATWTAWRPFRPAKVNAAGAQFRLRVIRDDTGVDVRIEGLQTQLRSARPSLYDITPEDLFLRSELESYG